MNCCLCVNWMRGSLVCLVWSEKSALSEAALASKAPCLVVCERGV
jgi:hypothetical protein